MLTRRRLLAGAGVLALIALALWWRGGGDDATARRPDAPAAAGAGAAASADARRDRIARHRQALGGTVARRALRGVVVDATGAAIPGATVRLARPVREVRAGDDGRFELVDLPPARVTVEAFDADRIAGPLPVDLRAGDADVTLRVYQGHALEVIVVAADDGRPIEGAAVEARAITMHDGAHRRRARTDRTGLARLPGLVYVGHELHVAAPGFADVRRGPGPDQDEVAPHVRRIRIAMPRAAAEVLGRVVDDDGAPVVGAVIEAVAYQAGQIAIDDDRQARRTGAADPHLALRTGVGPATDADGRFRVGLEPGTWIVLATADGRAPAASEPVFADAGARVELELVASRGRAVRGVVVTPDDRPVPGAAVQARWLDGEHVLAEVHADATGGFELRGLPPAPVVLVPSSEDRRGRPVAIDVTAADHDDAILTLDLDGAITGRVTDDAGAPVADAIVTYVQYRPDAAGVFPGVVVAGADGRFAIRGLAARTPYHVSAARPQHGGFAQHAVGRVAHTGEDVALVVPAPGAIVGRLAVAGDPRRLVVRELQNLSVATIERDGRFRIDGLPPNHYQLRISGPGVATLYPDRLEVRAGAIADAGTIDVAAGRRVAGTVVDAAGAPVDEATVRIEVDSRYVITTRSRRGAFDATVPDGAALVVSASHPATGRAPGVAIGAGARATGLRLAIAAGATVRGEARAHDRPLPDALVAVWPADGPRPIGPWGAATTDDAGRFEITGVPPGRWHVELLLAADPPPPRALRQTIELGDAAAPAPPVVFDATDAPAGTIPVPPPDEPDLPVFGDEGGEHGDEHDDH